METLDPAAVAAKIAADAPPPAAPAPAGPDSAGSCVTVSAPAPADAEKDSRGTPFDATKHTGKKHPHSGVWMPKGGRKPKSAATAAPGAPAAEAPARDASAWTDAAGAAAVDSVQPPSSPAETGGAGSGAAGPSSSPKDVAEVACRALYTVVGAVTKTGTDAKADPGDHANLRDTSAAYIQSKGWVFVGGFAVAVAVLAYLLRISEKPSVAQAVKALFTRKPKPVEVEKPAEPGQPAAAGPSPAPLLTNESGRVIPPLA